MHKPLFGQKVAILVANGFSEQDLIKTQRVAQGLGGNTRIVSMDQGLVNSWNGEGWGLNFASDQALNSALAADYSVLLIPGGQRSIDKLKLTAHTRRFINGFLASGKLVVAVNEASDILAFTEVLDGRAVANSETSCIVDGNLLSCILEESGEAEILAAVTDFLANGADEAQAVAA